VRELPFKQVKSPNANGAGFSLGATTGGAAAAWLACGTTLGALVSPGLTDREAAGGRVTVDAAP
jgi:hypothetical protein